MNYPLGGNCTSKLDPDLGLPITAQGTAARDIAIPEAPMATKGVFWVTHQTHLIPKYKHRSTKSESDYIIDILQPTSENISAVIKTIAAFYYTG